MDSKDDSGIDSDNKSASTGLNEPENKVEDATTQKDQVYNSNINNSSLKNVRKASDLQKKLEKQRDKLRKKDIVDEQPKRSFILPRNRLNIPNKPATAPLLADHQPLVDIISDDSEEDEFAVGAPLSREAQREITQQLIKDGYNLDLTPDDDDLDLIPPRPLHERWSCCPSATWIPKKCAVQ